MLSTYPTRRKITYGSRDGYSTGCLPVSQYNLQVFVWSREVENHRPLSPPNAQRTGLECTSLEAPWARDSHSGQVPCTER